MGNLLVQKPAIQGMEGVPTLVLQAHLDMVCVKDPESHHDFQADPIPLVVDGEWVTADGTSLGADNGIGVALCLAFLADPGLVHGPLEVLLTVDEETGLTGAFGLEPGFFSGKYLINVDSEDFNEITISSAGGATIRVEAVPDISPVVKDAESWRIGLSHCKGGHSGVDIAVPHVNPLKELGAFLARVKDMGVPIHLHSFYGGSEHNAIPKNAECVCFVPAGDVEIFQREYEGWQVDLEKKRAIEPNLDVQLESWSPDSRKALTAAQTGKVLNFLTKVAHGPLNFSTQVEGLVETSNNLGIVHVTPQGISCTLCSRSAVNAEVETLIEKWKVLAVPLEATVTVTAHYPGWAPDVDSAFLHLVKSKYEEISGSAVETTAVHAGLETGLFKRLDPNLQLVSIGPTIKNPHSTAERLNIPEVAHIWALLREIAQAMDTLE